MIHQRYAHHIAVQYVLWVVDLFEIFFDDDEAVDNRSTGCNGIPFFIGGPGALNDDADVGFGLRGTNCLENAEDGVDGGGNGAPLPKHAPDKYSAFEMALSTSISLPLILISEPSEMVPWTSIFPPPNLTNDIGRKTKRNLKLAYRFPSKSYRVPSGLVLVGMTSTASPSHVLCFFA